MTVELLNIDCMEYMATLEDNAFDLAIVDPPYGIGMSESIGAGGVGRRVEKSGSVSNIPRAKGSGKQWDNKKPSKEYYLELKRASKNQIIWGANHLCCGFDAHSPCWIVWNKLNGKTCQSDCELAYTSFKTTVRKFDYMWNGMIQGEQNKRNAEKRIHPTQKPVKLYQWLLQNYAKPGQRILDTHLGSGSSAIAAHYYGCDFVGCELDRDYYDAACKRFDKETRQETLFEKGAI
jgi:site-specific DNA-methyltransferase (adenine-specific)